MYALYLLSRQNISLVGWHKGENAGVFNVSARWYDENYSQISNETVYNHWPGTYDWTQWHADVTVPPLGYAVIVKYIHDNPASPVYESKVWIDDVATVLWEQSVDIGPTKPAVLATPNGWQYMRCDSAVSDTLSLNVTHRQYSSVQDSGMPPCTQPLSTDTRGTSSAHRSLTHTPSHSITHLCTALAAAVTALAAAHFV